MHKGLLNILIIIYIIYKKIEFNNIFRLIIKLLNNELFFI